MAPAKRFGSVRRLSSGRWQARYTHEARESKAPRTFATESEAETWLRIKRTELETGSQLLIRAKRTAGVTLADYSDEWLRERDLKARTRVLYRGQLDLYILPKLGKRSLTSIMAASTLNRHWNAARKAAGRPDLRWHDLRHTGATRAAQAGATTADLMARLGHSTIGAAMLYQHAAQDRDAQIAAGHVANGPDVSPVRFERSVLRGDAAELMGRLGHSTPGAALRYQHAAQGRDAQIALALSVLAQAAERP